MVFAALCLLCLAQVSPSHAAYTVSYSSTPPDPITITGPNGQQWKKSYSGAFPDSYGGGETSSNPPSGPGTAGIAGPGSVDCSGQIKATISWQADGTLRPTCIIIRETATASWSGEGGSGSDGLGGTATGPYGGSCQTVKYSVNNSSVTTFTKTCSPFADAYLSLPVMTEDGGLLAASASVSYKVEIFPVTIGLGGVTDPTTSPKVLTGQNVVATLSPGIGTVAPGSHNWSTTDDSAVFYEWNQSNGNLTLVPPNTNAEYKFYTRKEADLAVKCSATVNFPDATTGSVSVESASLHSIKPVATWGVDSTGVRFNVDPADGPAQAASFGAYDINPTRLGQYWSVTFTIEAPFSGGQGSFLQLGTFSRYEYVLNATAKPYRWKAPYDGEVLDTGFPYQIPDYPSTFLADPVVPGHSGDAPRSRTLSTASEEVSSDSFRTWLMYKPPAISGYAVRWVPVQKYTWSWSGTATQGISGNSGTGLWTLSNKAGATATAREPIDDFPSPWSVTQSGEINYIPDDDYDPNAPVP